MAMEHPQLPITTRSLLLRPFELADAGAVFALSNEATSRIWLPSQTYRDQAHAAAVLALLIDQYAAPGHPRRGPYVLAVEHRAERSLIGHVGFSPLGPDVEIGFAIGQAYQGQGLATETIVAASGWAFQTFGLDRILGITSVANHASRRALLRAGFAYQGDRLMRFQGIEQTVNVYMLAAT